MTFIFRVDLAGGGLHGEAREEKKSGEKCSGRTHDGEWSRYDTGKGGMKESRTRSGRENFSYGTIQEKERSEAGEGKTKTC